MQDMEGCYDRLLELCYQAVLEPNAWQELLSGLTEATGRQQGVLVFWNSLSPAGQVSNAFQVDTGAVDAYNKYYCNLDPTHSFMENRALGHWYHDERELGRERIRRDPFYQEYQQKIGLKSISCTKLHESQNTKFFLSFLLSKDAPHPSQQQQCFLSRITPHLLKAAHLSARFANLELHMVKRDILLDRQSIALWLLEDDGRVVYYNALAERIMQQSDHPLSQEKGRLVSKVQNGSLLQALAMAGGKTSPGRSSLLRLPTAKTLELLISPVAADLSFNTYFQRPLVLLAILDHRPQGDLLANLFQVSPAEQRLLEILTQGYSPEQCAGQLGISINTVRSQLRSLYRKTGTERQGELISFIGRLSFY